MTTNPTMNDAGPARGWRIAMWSGAAALLLAPLIAMRFTAEVNWGVGDFASFGAMLLAACGALEFVIRGSRNRAYRGAMALAVGTTFVLVWATLAVGFVGNEDHPANLMYAAVVAIVLLGGYAVRFRASPMARVLVVPATAQGIAGAVAVLAGWDTVRIMMSTLLFVGLWLASATLFERAAKR